jgi:predicted metal-dependent hydrolase
METLVLDGAAARVVWRRHARARRITLRIDPGQGQVVVTQPVRAARAAGLDLLGRNAAWVASRLAALPEVPPLVDGGSVPINGVPHRIRLMPGRRGSWLEAGVLHVSGDKAALPRRVQDFLRAEAKRRLGGQAVAKSAASGLVAQRVSVRDTRSRWGSCSPAGALMFCWRLVMAPLFVQDYVVAHEVAHLRHLDHGPEFWALADALSPHRHEAVTWLLKEGPRLLRVG